MQTDAAVAEWADRNQVRKHSPDTGYCMNPFLQLECYVLHYLVLQKVRAQRVGR